MAQFNYNQMQAQRAQYQNNNNNAPTERATVHFMNEYLKEDGSSLVVRFPYHSLDDVKFESVHVVMDYPKFAFGKAVRCLGENCPLCERGEKVLNKFYVKLKAYMENNGKIEAVNVVWERPAAYADIDLKGLMDEYGDLTKCLFRIKRTGQRTETRYTTNLVFNNAIYNDNTCNPDMSELDTIEPSRILSKSYEQYQNALHPENAEQTKPATTVNENVASTTKVAAEPTPAPTYTTEPAPAATTPKVEEAPKPVYQAPVQTERKKYTF